MHMDGIGRTDRPDERLACPSRIKSRTRVEVALSLSAAALLWGIAPPAPAGATPPSARITASHLNSPALKCDEFLARTLGATPSADRIGVIARLDGGTLTAARQAALTQADAVIVRRLPIIDAVALTVPSRRLARLAALPFVTHLSQNTAVKKYDEFTVNSSGAGAAMTQYGVTGSGVTVAVLDSGVREYDDLRGRLLASVSMLPGNGSTDDACGHGTHVAGIIAGNGASSTGPSFYRTFYGVARAANIVNVRVLDTYGQSDVATVVSGLQWTITNKSKYNIRVINLSLGHPVGESYTTDPLCQAVEKAWKAGIVVVCAAGNVGRYSTTTHSGWDNEGWGTSYGSIQSPGNDPYVITVGATKSMDGNRAHDQIATYSSRGPARLDMTLKPDIVAPGNRIISLYAWNTTLYTWATNSDVGLPAKSYVRTNWDGYSGYYFVLSGTSMAAPVVAGAAALLLQKYPTLSPDTVKARLMISADKWKDTSGVTNPCTFGAGYLNIPAALASNVVATQPALSPALARDSAGNVTMVNGNRVIWGTNITDFRVIWGTNAISGTSAATLSASRVIWGTSVWSDRVIWGTSSNAVDLTYTALLGEN